jgi:hypothetical protein
MKKIAALTIGLLLTLTACVPLTSEEESSPTPSATTQSDSPTPTTSSSGSPKASTKATPTPRPTPTRTQSPRPTATNSSTSSSSNNNTTQTTSAPTPTKTPVPQINANYNLRITIPNNDEWKQGQNVQFGWDFTSTNQNIPNNEYPLRFELTLEQNNQVKKTVSNDTPSYEGSANRWSWGVPFDLPTGDYTVRFKFKRQLLTPQGLKYPESTSTVKITGGQQPYTNLEGNFTGSQARVNFKYNGDPTYMNIFFSSASDMSNKHNALYIRPTDFAPYYVSIPPNWVWTPYQCGATIYWQVEVDTGVAKSDVQSSIVNCN